ncbi:hypothetical protein GCM10010965_14100 [Caldalkalibacillus thermarum]|uniref:FAD-binding oxidoreductase n=1 Tax=Caldalkalibacillus thermarum TaxID=296745 RepID=UPI00166422A2|nr:FAD-binding oxidoreductase [Caldalkalibacillus thermarum]GGK22338.1 hypothetical protein GCM10010965_14100 [Caldalkalibacillus thermarum]
MAYRKVDEEILQQVRGIISDDKRILTEKQDLIGYSYDASFGVFLPELVIQPTTAQEVAAVVKLAYEETIPVYPRGLDLSHMNKKLEVVPDDLIAIVSPGYS